MARLASNGLASEDTMECLFIACLYEDNTENYRTLRCWDIGQQRFMCHRLVKNSRRYDFKNVRCDDGYIVKLPAIKLSPNLQSQP